MARKKKKIYLALGNGFNNHFHLKTNYYDFIKDHYQEKNELYNNLFCIESKHNPDEVWNFIKSNHIEYNIWECYFVYGLDGINSENCKSINFEKMQWESFDSGFWFDVLQRAYQYFDLPDDEKEFFKKYPKVKEINDSTRVKGDGKVLLQSIRKKKFFSQLIMSRYLDQLNDASQISAEKCISKFYEILFIELESFEKDFGLFVEKNGKLSKESNQQVRFIDKLKRKIDPNGEYELEILNFNFNTIGKDVSDKYKVYYVHGNFENPIFGFALQHREYRKTNNDFNSLSKIIQNRYACLFSPLYQRTKKGLTQYSKIINKKNENILAFYGLSFSKYDCEEFYLLHEYQSKCHPIYLFYSNYDKKNPHLLGDYLYTLYSNFYVDYYNYVVMDQFYWLIEDGDIEIKEV